MHKMKGIIIDLFIFEFLAPWVPRSTARVAKKACSRFALFYRIPRDYLRVF